MSKVTANIFFSMFTFILIVYFGTCHIIENKTKILIAYINFRLLPGITQKFVYIL